VIVRAARPDDFAAIRACADAAFGQPAEGALTEALRDSRDAVVELVAENDARLVGYVLLSRLAAPADCLALAPLAVAPDFQRRGIGAALVSCAIEAARAQGAAAIFLLGDPAYYSRFGFSVAAAAKFETDYPKPHMMALELAPGALGALSGAIRYPAAFNEL
jgi:putative acetyltransferase